MLKVSPDVTADIIHCGNKKCFAAIINGELSTFKKQQVTVVLTSFVCIYMKSKLGQDLSRITGLLIDINDI